MIVTLVAPWPNPCDGPLVVLPSARRLPAPEPPGYYRRRPEETVLYEALRTHLASFLERCDESGSEATLPAHVRGELERFLTCGILAHGFVRVRCPSCRDDLLVAALEYRPGVTTRAVDHAMRRLLQKIEATPSINPAFDEIRSQVRNEWVRRAGDRALRVYLDQLRAESQVLTALPPNS